MALRGSRALKKRVSARARSRLKLRIELIPKPLWEKNLRSSDGLGKARWDKLRTFDDHALRSRGLWLKRSKKKWRVDWGDFKPMVAEAEAAREAWAARNPDHVTQDDLFNVRPGHHMRNRCPECGAVGTLTPIEANRGEMSEGQEADYDQGTWGFAFCRACQSNVFWQAVSHGHPVNGKKPAKPSFL